MVDLFQIHILDDNQYFLKVFERRLQTHANFLSLGADFEVSIRSFSDAQQFLSHMDRGLDVAILDFQLGHGVNALGILNVMHKKGCKPNVAIISEYRHANSQVANFSGIKLEFIPKDTYILPKSCLFIEATLLEKGYRL